MLSRAAAALKGVVRSQQPLARRGHPPGPGGGVIHASTSTTHASRFHTVSAAAGSLNAALSRSAPDALARKLFAHILTQLELAVPNTLRAGQRQSTTSSSIIHNVFLRALKNLTNNSFISAAYHGPVSTQSIARGLSLPSRIALSGPARTRAFGAPYYFPRVPGSGAGGASAASPFGRGPAAVTHVGLGAARNFSTGAVHAGRPVFENLVQNVPVLMRALCEADLDLKVGDVNTLRKKRSFTRINAAARLNNKDNKLQQPLHFSTVPQPSSSLSSPVDSENKTGTIPSSSSVKKSKAERRRAEFERFFGTGSSSSSYHSSASASGENYSPDEPFITTLSIPLDPPSHSTKRTPLPGWQSNTTNNNISISIDANHPAGRSPDASAGRMMLYDSSGDSIFDSHMHSLRSNSDDHDHDHATSPAGILWPDELPSSSYPDRDSAPTPGPRGGAGAADGDRDELLLGLDLMQSMHGAYAEHARNVSGLFAALDAAGIWTRGASCDQYRPPRRGGSHHYDYDYHVRMHGEASGFGDVIPKVVDVRFDGWSEESVCDLLTRHAFVRLTRALEWCEIRSVAKSILSSSSHATSIAIANPWDGAVSVPRPTGLSLGSEDFDMARAGRVEEEDLEARFGAPGISFVMPTLDLSFAREDTSFDRDSFAGYSEDEEEDTAFPNPAVELELDSMIDLESHWEHDELRSTSGTPEPMEMEDYASVWSSDEEDADAWVPTIQSASSTSRSMSSYDDVARSESIRDGDAWGPDPTSRIAFSYRYLDAHGF
ncbi:hypothetical protein DL93DRAFT_2072485 [Clavulina sp. PMI_390]|nr:hypothetical protein DL93DRAFT_2072485 [Clavulina sp. PMI_390]